MVGVFGRTYTFKGPKEGAQQVSVKSHIMRPIDFILMGLREEFNLYSEDGSHLSAPGTIRLLKEQNLIPQEDISRIESVYNQAMKTRFDMHAEHKKEHDEMPFAAAEEMLVEVEKIRTLGSQRIANIEHKENVAVAATLWEQANGMLEAADVVGYLKAAKNLHQFMGGKNISQDDMRRQLIDQEISPKAFAVLQEIYGAASDYSRNAASLTELSQESGLVSAAGKTSAFFMDCKLSPNERANIDPDFKMDRSKTLIGIMQFIKDVVDNGSKIWIHGTKALMNYKISEIQKLEKNDNVNPDTLDNILSSKGEDLPQYLSYKFATMSNSEGREHKHAASTENFQNLKGKYLEMRGASRGQELEGDALKTKILAEFKGALAEATDETSLEKIVETLKGKDEYKILAQGQGTFTKVFGLKTTSVSAFEHMVEEAKDDILSQQSLKASGP